MSIQTVRRFAAGAAILSITTVSGHAADVEATLGSQFSPTVPVIACGALPMAEDPDLIKAGIHLKVIPSGQLGTENQLAEQISSGELEMAPITSSILASWVSDMSVFESYYLYKNVDQAMAVYNTNTAKTLLAELEKTANIHVIGRPWLYGERHIFGKKMIDGPADLEGLKFRIPNTTVSIAGAKSIKASPTPVAYSELYMALQQGIVDAAEAPLSVIKAESFDEPANYVNLTSHLITALPFIVNEDFWQSLSPDQQAALEKAVEAGSDRVRVCAENNDAAAVAEWKKDGKVEVHMPKDLDAIRAESQAYFSKEMPFSDTYKKLVVELNK